MYKSPIEIICADMQKQIDNDIYRVTQKYEIKVDKNELIQALAYDRDQYSKGYTDGKAGAMADLVRCKDCIHRVDGSKMCAHPKAIGWDAIEPEDYDFCSYGERREG